jgi:holo-[acyl-carrier protein] synthase
MITGLGIDIVEISRFKKILQTKNFIEKCFSDEEKDLNLQSLAGRFAAREALFKALDKKEFFRLSEIKIVNEACGQPKFVLSGAMLEYCKDKEIILSISHEIEYAVSFVLIQSVNLEF